MALIGIEIKNSILLVDFTNQLREEGKPLDEATIFRAGAAYQAAEAWEVCNGQFEAGTDCLAYKGWLMVRLELSPGGPTLDLYDLHLDAEAGTALGVQAVLTGRILQHDNRISVAVELVNDGPAKRQIRFWRSRS